MVNEIMEAMPCKPRLCLMERGGDGYGFNLHGERGQHGQYIRAVDDDSPADVAGLKQGDRVVEVNGVNIERETHSQVVTRIREGGTKTCLLVVNNELDAYCRKHSITVKESMVEGSRSSLEMSPMVTNEDDDLEVHMNGDVGEDPTDSDEVIVARIDTEVEALPERDEEEEEEERREATPEPEESMQEAVQPRYDEGVEEHGYAEIQRRDDEEEEEEEREVEEREEEEEKEEEEEEEMMFVAAEAGEARTAEIKGVSEEVIQPQENTIEESVPAPPQEREEESDVNVPEPEPEPVLEAATVPMVESAPPPPPSEPEPVPEPEPVKAPAPQAPAPVVEPPKKIEAPAPPRPTAAPTPGPAPEQRKSEMEKARILAAGRKKKKEASKRNWEDKFATFNNL